MAGQPYSLEFSNCARTAILGSSLVFSANLNLNLRGEGMRKGRWCLGDSGAKLAGPCGLFDRMVWRLGMGFSVCEDCAVVINQKVGRGDLSCGPRRRG